MRPDRCAGCAVLPDTGLNAPASDGLEAFRRGCSNSHSNAHGLLPAAVHPRERVAPALHVRLRRQRLCEDLGSQHPAVKDSIHLPIRTQIRSMLSAWLLPMMLMVHLLAQARLQTSMQQLRFTSSS